MRIVITGAKGQLGLELTNQLAKYEKYEVIATDREALNIVDVDAVNKFILETKPDVVINCAAHTAVDLCETDVENAYKINAYGAKNLAIACEKIGAKMVQLSTDYVFDGMSSKPYRECDMPRPKSVYAKSKLEGERFTKEYCSRYFIIRSAWLYGEGDNFVRTMINLSKTHNQINVVDDQIGSPTSTVDLVRVIISLISTEYYGIYHATCEGQCSWYNFAKKIFELSNINIDVKPITSEEFKRPAQRPSFSVLENAMLNLKGINSFRHWEEAIEEYIHKELHIENREIAIAEGE